MINFIMENSEAALNGAGNNLVDEQRRIESPES